MHYATIMIKSSYNPSPRTLSHLERVLSYRLKQQLKSKDLNLSVEEFRALFYLWFDNGLTQNEIAAKAFKEKSLMTKTINSLERKGLIERKRMENDKRNKQIFLTQKAIDMEVKAMACANVITRKAEENISNEDLEVFFRVINQMENNLK